MSSRVPVERAKFTPKSGRDKDKSFTVHFNPVSLQYSVSNTLKEEGSGKTKKQYVTQGTGKLTMDLVFDNTGDGQDVRLATSRLAALMQADPKSSGSTKQVPSIVLLEWGVYKFQGMMESYKETLDFFAPGGVPLRASVSITLVEQDKIFAPGASAGEGAPPPDLFDVPNGPHADPSSVASKGGDPGAARAVAALNGEASLRFTAGAALTVGGGISLSGPAAFASGGAGVSGGGGLGLGGGIGVGGGAGFGAAAGAGMGASGGAGVAIAVGAGAGARLGATTGVAAGAVLGATTGVAAGASFGAGAQGGASAAIGVRAAGSAVGRGSAAASAGVAASEGAFAGLRSRSEPAPSALDTDQFRRQSDSVALSTTGAETDFLLGGQAAVTGSAGLAADVGANADLRARIRFEGE